jgi:hypothetical protein
MASFHPSSVEGDRGNAATSSASSSPEVIVRFYHINDVYELDDLPRYGTALKEVSHIVYSLTA